MIQRSLGPIILHLAKQYPVISITGPRQSGKTTLAKILFPHHAYRNLENPDVLAVAQADPRTFLKLATKDRMIIDEVQRFPDLLSYMQDEVDTQKLPGRYIITGSQNFALTERVTQSLAGRVATCTLLPFTLMELDSVSKVSHDLFTVATKGFYPRIYDRSITEKDFYREYVFTYVERDVRQIKNIGNLTTFQRFLTLVAGRVGQLVNLSSLANDTGVSYKTIDAWLSILEASYIIFRLQPYYKNYGKRLIKSPKLYFYDTGLLCYLLGIDTPGQLVQHYAMGSVAENVIIADLVKCAAHSHASTRLYFWRDNAGHEIDLLIDQGTTQTAIEIKAGKTFHPDMIQNLIYWQKLSPARTKTALVYSGKQSYTINGCDIVNWYPFLITKHQATTKDLLTTHKHAVKRSTKQILRAIHTCRQGYP